MLKGKTDDFRITVMQVIPNYFVLIDGAHRLCAWQIMCKANPALDNTFTVQVIALTITWDQLEIVARGKNDMPIKKNDLMDNVCTPQLFLLSIAALLVLD